MFNATRYGWVDEPDGRGTWDILSTCVLTITLCCWTSVCPNIPSSDDGFFARMRDKLHLACLGILGPEFLLMITLGEWSSARASVKGFRELGHHDWTISHAFYVDMGGLMLEGPGIKTPFPIDGRQLLFLVRKKYVRYPHLTRECITDRNKSDGFARFITIFQALWMVVNCLVRVAQGLALTTIELTTLSFILAFLIMSFCWFFKPLDITTRDTLHLETHLDRILIENGHSPQEIYYQTPLDFISRETHFCERFWRYYTRILGRLHLPVFSRPVSTIPYSRFPSDRFMVLDFTADAIGASAILAFGCIFMFAWNFSFPSTAERILWRICSTYMLVFTFVGCMCAQYCQKILFPNWSVRRREVLPSALERPRDLPERLRNIQQSRDPRLDIPIRALIPVTILCVLYCVCRYYILVEDVIGLRSLPKSAYQTVDWSVYVPHW